MALKATFRVTEGEKKGQVFELAPGKATTLGRSKESGLEVAEAGVSRIHCQLTNDGKRVILTDLRSTNGTYLNERRVRSAPLEDGDEVRVGKTVIVLKVVQEDVEEARRDRVETPTAEPKAGKKEEPEEAIADIKPGVVIAGCKLVEEVGRKRNVASFRAVQSWIGRSVQVKILLNSKSASDMDINRFLGPAKSAGRLSHPNVIQIHGAGQDVGYYYVIEEFISGKSIASLIAGEKQAGAVAVALGVEVATKLAEVLAYAHSQRVMHGDINPAKVLVVPTERSESRPRNLETLGTLKLTEFGSGGYLLGSDLTDEKSELMRSSRLHGYCAPEQLGRDVEVDHRADVYSLGALLYFMLTGRPPFEERTPDSLVAAIRKGETKSPSELNPSSPKIVCSIVLKAMAPDPEKRFQSAAEMLSELRELTALQE